MRYTIRRQGLPPNSGPPEIVRTEDEGGMDLPAAFRRAKEIANWRREIAEPGSPLDRAIDTGAALFSFVCVGLSLAALAKMGGLL